MLGGRTFLAKSPGQKGASWGEGLSLPKFLDKGSKLGGRTFLAIIPGQREHAGWRFLARIPGQREHAEGRSLPEFLDKGSMPKGAPCHKSWTKGVGWKGLRICRNCFETAETASKTAETASKLQKLLRKCKKPFLSLNLVKD